MHALFLLLPDGALLDGMLAALPAELAAARKELVVRVYPRATSAAQLHSLVRAGRDPVATRRWRGLFAAIGGGALLGMVTAGVLAGAFRMLGGRLDLALPFGLFVGAFLGGFTAAMAGTEVARPEVRELAKELRPGDVLVSIAGAPAVLAALRAHCDATGFASRRRQ